MNARRVKLAALLALVVALPLLVLLMAGCSPAYRGTEASVNNRLYQQQREAGAPPYSPPAATGVIPFAGTKGMADAGSIGPQTGAGATASPPSRGISYLVPPQSLPSPNEELWIIQKPAADVKPQPGMIPGSGTLVTTPPGSSQIVPVPLQHTDVNASIAGYIATVDVRQQFHNPYAGKIEAVYVFPLPSNAAVNEFLMTVGERTIRGIIRERQEAEKLYAEARGQGYVASLLTQERPNVFTQKVANIEPGKRIDIDIKYFHTLNYDDGWYEWAFPMVVGPRFNPPGSTDGIGAVGQGSRGASGQKTEVQYLRPEQRSGHDINLSVALDAGVAVERVECKRHKVSVQRDGPNKARVTLDAGDRIPNKDFVLRYQVAGRQVKGSLVAQRDKDGRGGYFTLMLFPPADVSDLPRQPLEMVFTLDVSGSMMGKPLEQSVAAMRYALAHMGRDDTFQVVRFAGDAEQLAPAPVPATPQNVKRALAYVQQTQAGGGTMMLRGIQRSLEPPQDRDRPRFVAFLTDGYIGNEAEILSALHQSLNGARVFSFGVGSAPNRYLLDAMAKLGRGAAAYLSLNDSADAVMAQYFERISHPALTDVAVDFGPMGVTDVFPRQVPDLFVGRPVILTGRYTGELPKTVMVEGRVGGETKRFPVPVDADNPAAVETRALPLVWARMKIAELAERAITQPNADLAQEVRQVAMEYGLMSSFTAFVAVDSLTRTAGEFGTTVNVPVPVPDGVRYDTTVQERAQPASDQ